MIRAALGLYVNRSVHLLDDNVIHRLVTLRDFVEHMGGKKGAFVANCLDVPLANTYFSDK